MSKKLLKELQMQRVSEQEAVKLADLADMVALVNPPGLSRAAKQRIANRLPVDVDLDQPKKNYAFRWAMAGLAGSFAVFFILMTSLVQSALPDPTVYNAQDGKTDSKKSTESKVGDRMLDAPSTQSLKSETRIKEEPIKPEVTQKPKADRRWDSWQWWRYDNRRSDDSQKSSSRDQDRRWWD